MRALIVLPWEDLNALGGVNVIVRQLTAYLSSQGDDVSLLTTKWSGKIEEEEFGGKRVFRFPLRSPALSRRTLRSRLAFALLFPISLYRLARLLKRERIDVVNFLYFSDEAFFFVFLRRWLRFRFVVNLHGSDALGEEGKYNVALLNRWIRRIDELVACSDALKNAGLPPGSAADRKAKVLRNCVDVSSIQIPDQRVDVVISVANLIPRKGLDVLIKAFARLAPAFPAWQLWLVGSGEMLQQLQKLVEELNCQSQVQFLGRMERDQALARVAQARVFCLSSHREGLPLAVLEAMALKTPVVATRVEGMPETIENRVHGILVDPGSVSQLSAALEELMSNENKAVELASNAFARIQSEFSYENWGRRYRQLLEGM
jgi:glycosyltransferase involved in cell wall biosynthesis